MRDLKVLLVTNAISPYRIPTFNHLAEKLDVLFVFLCPMLKNYKLKVFWDKIRFKCQVLQGTEVIINNDFTLHFTKGFVRALRKFDPAVVVSLGYTYFETFIGLFYAKLYHKKFVLWSGSTLQSGTSRNALINFVKKFLFHNCDAFLAYGSAAAECLISHGVPWDKVVVGCNTVDVMQFSTARLETSEQEKNNFKAVHGLLPYNILYSGQLLPRKNLSVLLKAFGALNRSDWGLIIVGDGPMKEAHMDYCSSQNITNVFFKGHQDLEQLTKYYIASDIFVLPSTNEVWGLVVNEAMACGLPVLCSRSAGVAQDLVLDQINGYLFDPSNVVELKEKLLLLVDDPDRCRLMGESSMRIISKYTPQKYASDLIKAIELAFLANNQC